jgi:hypothetical protein
MPLDPGLLREQHLSMSCGMVSSRMATFSDDYVAFGYDLQ